MNIGNNKKETAVTPLNSFAILAARVVNGNSVSFDMVLNGVTIYGCWVRSTKDGKDFISYPQRKGNDNKYYSIVFVKLSDADQKKILDTVEKMLQ